MSDDDELSARVEAHLQQAAGSSVAVRGLRPLGGGACQDNYRVDLSFPDGERRLVLRSDAKRSLPGSIDRRQEFEVIGAAVTAGVKTPAARWLGRGLVREGAWAYFLDWVDGDAIGKKVVRGPELEAAREGLGNTLAAELARIHGVVPAAAPGISLAAPEHPALEALRFARAMVAELPEPRLGIELAVHWLGEHLPEGAPPCLVHGDFRTGNFMVSPEGLTAVLDWEFAHFGSPAEDLAWIALRNWRFGRNDRPIGGISARAPFYEAYERAGGRPVARREVHWWEVLGNIRWATGSIQQGERFLGGAEQDLELLAIPLHASEMELEALRLIEKGP